MILDQDELRLKLINLEKEYPDVLNQFEKANAFEQVIFSALDQGDLPNSGPSLESDVQSLALEGRSLETQPADFILTSASVSDAIFDPYVINDEIVSGKFCVLPNPYSQSLIQRACRGIHLIDQCLNALGLPDDSVSIYRFEYLITKA